MTVSSTRRRKRRASLSQLRAHRCTRTTSQPTPDRLTKLVEEKHFAGTLKGHLRIGTLTEYRPLTSTAKHRLSDTNEGTQHAFTDQQYFDNEEIRGVKLIGMKISGHARTVVVEDKDYGLVFCCTRGKYRSDVHTRMLRKNPDLSHYVEFDRACFMVAMRELRKHLSRSITRRKWIVRPVIYDDEGRMPEVSVETLKQMPRRFDGFLRATFIKPQEFAHEEELRFALPTTALEEQPVLIRDMPDCIAQLFQAAVSRHGSFI